MNLNLLPEGVRNVARVDLNGEVAWPLANAREAVEALARAGFVVLGLDARTYNADGSFMEVAWSSFEPAPSAYPLEDARLAAVAALTRPDVPGDWVVVTAANARRD